MRSRNFRPIGFINGVLLTALSVAMLFPMLIDLAAGNPDWSVFLLSAMLTALVGASMSLASHERPIRVERHAGYLLTVSAWCLLWAFGALPIYFSSLNVSITDAAFEAVSGLTTTGSTVLTGLDTMPPGILLWRSLLQWIGGAGIIVGAIVLLPVLGIGGMQLFRMESSDISGKPTYSAYQMAWLTIGVYAGLSVACAIGYAEAGMSPFDAINHAMATIATGGFSTHDLSMGYFDSPAIEMVGTVFMLSAAFPLIWYGVLLTRPRGRQNQERQVPALIGVFVVAVALMTLWNVEANDMPLGLALRQTVFNVTSVLTDTGFASTDFSTWGSFAVGMFFALLFVGGCAGSTAGSVKVFRWQLMFAGALRRLTLTLTPSRIAPIRYGGRVVDDDTLHSVRNFFFMYIMTFAVLSLVVMAAGLDFLSSTSGVAQAMAGAGPGLGPVVGPAGNFASLTPLAKWALMAAMLLGRLELSTVYVLFLREYWNWR